MDKKSPSQKSQRRLRRRRYQGSPVPPEQEGGVIEPVEAETSETIEKLNDRLLRMKADYENFRKRVTREREEQAKFALEGLMKEIVVSMDNFDRALEHRAHTPEVEAFAKGLELTHRHLWDVLQKHGLERIDARGKMFDPMIHEALSTEEKSGVANGTVLDVIQEGYTLNGRVIRPALVKVAKAV